MIDKDINTLENKYNTTITNGLTTTQANRLIKESGLNILKVKKKENIFIKFFKEFNDILIIILLVSAVVSVLVDPHAVIESMIILVVVFINALLGLIQEFKAEKSLEALNKLSTPNSKVIRDSKVITIPSTNLVKGDILICKSGDYISADGRIIESNDLKVDESSLTGESVPVLKHSNIIIEEDLSLGDKKNMVFSSTFITGGNAKVLITNTGMDTEVGKIASMLLKNKDEKTPLQLKLDQIGKIIGLFAILICIIVFILEVRVTNNPMEAFKRAVSLAVAAIPEGLSAVVTVILAFGVQKMVKKNAIIKKLPAVETLGCASVVCSDKTGTLTINKMTIVKASDKYGNLCDIDKLPNNQHNILKYMAMCTNAFVTETEEVGDATELAIIKAYNTYINAPLEHSRHLELPFDSTRKLMSVVVTHENEHYLITKGAIDIILNRCINVDKKVINKVNTTMASDALRVLGVAYKKIRRIPSEIKLNMEDDLNFVGLVGLIDPIKPEAKDAILEAKKAGIKTVMITGDHKITAMAIGKELGILNDKKQAISSYELNNMSDKDFEENIENFSVYARVSPTDKVKIVKTWQSKGHVVAMTGDGVNDSPALKQADIGCAMGIMGTDVSKEASSMILVDDNYKTIIDAVKEGRGIYDNIKKTVWYLLSSNIGEVFTIFVASLISVFYNENFGIPLFPIHLLWINLVTDLLPAFSLGLEKVDNDVMKKSPRNKEESFFSDGLWYTILWQGILTGILTLVAYIIGNNNTHGTGVTMAFLTLSTTQLFHAFNVKSEKTIFSRQVFNNKFLWFSLIIGLVLQSILLINPFLRGIFRLEQLSFKHLLITFWLSFSMIIMVEITKLIKRIVKR